MKKILLTILATMFFIGCSEDSTSPKSEPFISKFYPEIGLFVINERLNPGREGFGRDKVNIVDSAEIRSYYKESLYNKVVNDDSYTTLDSKGRWYIEKFDLSKNTFEDLKTEQIDYGIIMESFTPNYLELRDSESSSIDVFLMFAIRDIEVNSKDTVFKAESWLYVEYKD